MELNEYQQLSTRTMPDADTKDQITNYAMGLSGECGEVVDLLKKTLFHGHAIDRSELLKELGDVLHYLSGLATIFGFDLDYIAQMNIEKLKLRYPNGFNQHDSINRKQ